MQTTPFDFVGALSAEEQCPVCQEMHAAVDECFCSSCLTHVCRDCSTLQPDTSWICTSCAALLPPRAFPMTVRSPRDRALHASHALREHSRIVLREVVPAVERGGELARARALSFARFVQVTWAAALAWLAPRARSYAARANSARLRLLANASSALSRSSLKGWSAHSVTSLPTRIRRASSATLRWLRTFPVRHYAMSFLLATIILIAVARAENTDAS